ncbi:MAG: efflux RND transporter periplasmic adaptor subunit [Desulfotomaculaceae bacterium]|nr:efflux RND transporter periplasmic adaptor subunit [Desulfotomaculaceae bacterium]
MKKTGFIVSLFLMIVSLAGISLYYWYQNSYFVHTEDARIDGDMIKVSPQITGKILELPVEEGQTVEKNSVVCRQSDLTLTSGINLDLTVIKAPISGTIIKKIAHVGEIATPTVPILIMTDLKSLYITANIEEDKLEKVKQGQLVEISIDQFPGIHFKGQVVSVGNAANSVFSLLPTQNTGNSFVKTTQRVPVKISIEDYQGQRLLPGMNAIVKIHIR